MSKVNNERTTIMADQVDNMNYKIPLQAISVSCRKKLSLSLLPERLVPTHTGITRDWQGLCELAGFDFDLIQLLKTKVDPVAAMLDQLALKQFTVDNLINMLELMERFDVIQDIRPSLQKNTMDYTQKKNDYGLNLKTNKKKENEALNLTTIKIDEKFRKSTKKTKTSKIPVNTLLQSSITYDAYVSYSESDVDFVFELVEKMEKSYRLRLFIKDRDMLPGTLNIEEDLKLINERCKKILIIASEESLTDPYCEFQSIVAQSAAVGSGMHYQKLIPIICKPCVLPYRFQFLAKLDYTKKDQFGIFWDRLYRSIKNDLPNPYTQSIKRQKPT